LSPCSWKGFVQIISQCGSLEYAIELSKWIKGRRAFVMLDFTRQMEDQLNSENHARLTVWTAMRDKGSTLNQLGPDVLRMVLELARVPRPVLWEEIL